ncbi:hypothetical protein FKM82_017486 [Ascaphus truei]
MRLPMVTRGHPGMKTDSMGHMVSICMTVSTCNTVTKGVCPTPHHLPRGILQPVQEVYKNHPPNPSHGQDTLPLKTQPFQAMLLFQWKPTLSANCDATRAANGTRFLGTPPFSSNGSSIPPWQLGGAVWSC